MITKTEFETLINEKFISLVRVVTVPQENTWCIDAIIRRPLATQYQVERLSSGTSMNSVEICRFGSLDKAAAFLHAAGIKSFVVDQKGTTAEVALSQAVTKHRESSRKELELELDR